MLLIDELFDTHGNNTFLAVAAVVGHDDELVAGCTHFILHDDEVLASSGNHAEHTVARSLQRLDDREHRSYAYATTGTDDGTEVLDMCWVSERTYYVMNLIAFV